MRTILWFIAFWVYQFILLFFMLYYVYLDRIGKKEIKMQYLNNVSSKWARAMVRWTGSKVELIGSENIPEENVLYVSNHQSNFDIPTIMGYVPKLKGFVAKVELERMPMISRWMKELGCVFLDRKDPRQSLKAILKGIDNLKAGHTMVVFPEGTRSKGNQMGEFKKGSMKLAIKGEVPIVPITIDGTYKMLEEKKRIRPANITIRIHPPIYMDTLSKEEKNQLVDKVYEIIQEPLLKND